MRDIPDRLLYLVCPECGQSLTSSNRNVMVATGLDCPTPDCIEVLGKANIKAVYEKDRELLEEYSEGGRSK